MMNLQSGLAVFPDIISISVCIKGLAGVFVPCFFVFFFFFKPSNSSVLGSSMISCHFVKPQLQSSTTYKESGTRNGTDYSLV